MYDIFHQLMFFARAGGGGSSSGGGGGAGIFLVIPGIVAALTAEPVKKRTQSKAAGAAVGFAAGLLVSLLYLLGGPILFIIALISAVVGAVAGALTDKLGRFRQNSQAARQTVQQAAMQDGAWNEQGIISYVTTVFNRFQYDWKRNVV